MNYIIWDTSPEVIEGFVFFRWYGLCWILGLLLAYKLMYKFFQAERISIDKLDQLTIYLVAGIILGARFGHILFYDPIHYWNNPIEILPVRINPTFEFTGLAGLASHGGIVGALSALYFYSKKAKMSYLWLLDRITIAGAALGGFIRVGNLMNSEMIGVPTNLPWAFVFTRIDQVPRHPAQLYEAMFYFAISIALYLMWRSNKVSRWDGFISGLGMTLIFCLRFGIEFFKENQVSFEENLSFNMGQILSIPIIIAGIALMIFSRRRMKRETLELPDGNLEQGAT